MKYYFTHLKLNSSLKILLLAVLVFSCSDRQPKKVKIFKDPDPIKIAYQHSKVKFVYYVVENSSDTTSPGSQIGDTLYREEFDSSGNLVQVTSYSLFGGKTNYYYDENGGLQYKRIMSDYLSEFYLASFIDTFKRIKYIKEPEPLLGTPYLSLTYYNEEGLPDSLETFTMKQRRRVKYWEYFHYENGRLSWSRKQTTKDYLDDANEGDGILADTIVYDYSDGKLRTVTQTEIYPRGRRKKIIDQYDKNEAPLSNEFRYDDGYFRKLKAIINTSNQELSHVDTIYSDKNNICFTVKYTKRSIGDYLQESQDFYVTTKDSIFEYEVDLIYCKPISKKKTINFIVEQAGRKEPFIKRTIDSLEPGSISNFTSDTIVKVYLR